MPTNRRSHGRGTAARAIAGGGLAVAATLLSGSVAQAQAAGLPTVTVTGTGDPTSPFTTVKPTNETLADAIAYLDTTPSGGTITFASSLSGQTINLITSLPAITVPITIEGPGAGNLTISGGGTAGPLFYVAPDLASTTTISGVTIEDASHATGDGDGGAIEAHSPLDLESDVLTGNYATTAGGAIYSDASALTIDDSTVSGNTSGGNGGGIEFWGNGNLQIVNSTLSGNTSDNWGGGLMAYDATTGTGAKVQVENSTIADNTADGGAGGLYVGDYAQGRATLSVLGSTISGNATDDGAGAGIFSTSANVTLDDTIDANNTSEYGGGPYESDLYMSAYNSASAPSGTASFSLIGDGVNTGAYDLTTDSTDLSGDGDTPLDPQLGALASNGGPTQTMLPQAGSPAIGAGNASVTSVGTLPAAFTSDQRGDARNGNGSCSATTTDGTDIGAVEVTAGSGSTSSCTTTTTAPPAPTTPTPAPTTSTPTTPAPAVAKRSVSYSNQKITLTTTPKQTAVAATVKLPVSFSSAAIRGSKKRAVKFKEVQFYLDRGVKHVVHKLERVHGKLKWVTVTQWAANATSKKSKANLSLTARGVSKGSHTLKAVITYTERVSARRTKTVHASVSVKVTLP